MYFTQFNQLFALREVTTVRKYSNKFDINVEFYRDSVEEMQAFLYIRCSKIWYFAHLFVTFSRSEIKIYSHFLRLIEILHYLCSGMKYEVSPLIGETASAKGANALQLTN